MADDDPTQMMPPDDMDDFLDDVDPDAYLAVEQELYDMEQQGEEGPGEGPPPAQNAELSGAGQSNPRRLDFAAYGNLSGVFSDPLQPPAASQAATAPLTASQLQLRLSTESQSQAVVPSAAAPGPNGLSHFQRERMAEEQRQASSASVAVAGSSPFARAPSAVVPPAMLRSVSELRQRVLDSERVYVFRRAPAVGDYMAVTVPEGAGSAAAGERVYVTMASRAETEKKLAAHRRAHRSQAMHRDLGQVNVRRMMRELDEEALASSIKASAAEAKARELDSDPEDDERTKLRKRRQRKERLIARLDKADRDAKLSSENRRLWVDKYRPRSYADLLSPETINREVLEWLRGWDQCVFGTKRGAAGTAVAGADANARTLDNHLLTNNLLGPGQKKPKKTGAVLSADGETDVRPEHKIILLCGPPGLGKTTLAHVLARQAGYNPFEINASDDRSGTVLEAKIRAATEMQAVSFGGGHAARPNCVILDEIDGVAGESAGSQDAIGAILKIVQAEPRGKGKAAGKDDDDAGGGDSDSDADGEDEKQSATASSRKSKRSAGDGSAKSRPGPLKRPIIAICNDQFAAALRPLRAVARVFEFTAAPKIKFVDRLKLVSRNEGLDVDTRTLGALADLTDCDIRSALNTLQFVHSRGTTKLTATHLNALALGRKDVEKSRLTIWEAVFSDKDSSGKRDQILHFKDMRETEQAPRNRTAGAASSASAASAGGATGVAASAAPLTAKESKSRELAALLASSSAELDKVLEGVYHNYPSMGYADPSMGRTAECADWMAYADLLEKRGMGSAGEGGAGESEGALDGYAPYAILGVHYIASRPRKVKLEFPSMLYHQHVAQLRNEQVLRSFLSPANCFAQQGATAHATVLDVLPHVLDILHPAIRAVNFALLTSREKAELANLVDTMLALAVSYRAEIISSFGSASLGSAVPAWKAASAGGLGTDGASNVVYKMEPAIELLAQWSNPLDAATSRSFEPANAGGKYAKKTPFGQPLQPVQQNFHIEKRDMNMPNKVKREVLRELEFESMRRAEAARAERFKEEEHASAVAAAAKSGAAALPPGSPDPNSLLSPAVQRLLDAERKKRERAEDPVASPPTAASKIAGAAAFEDDVSPATKRAKQSAAGNFLARHADAARNNKVRRRGAATATNASSGKLDLTGLPTEGEQKAAADTASTATAGMKDVLPSSAQQAPAAPAKPAHPLHYKYNDGCTNAVRRTIQVAHFMPL